MLKRTPFFFIDIFYDLNMKSTYNLKTIFNLCQFFKVPVNHNQ